MFLEATFDDNDLAKKLSVFSSGLGNIFNELLKEVGDEMAVEAKSNASSAFTNRSGKLERNIKFIINKDIGALTTKKSLNKSNIFYAKFIEYGRKSVAKNDGYLTFKINGEWKKCKRTESRPRPFMRPVFDTYFENENGIGFKKLQEALMRKIESELD